jgi:hypothetical protein
MHHVSSSINSKGATPNLVGRSGSLLNRSTSPFARTPGGIELNKSPLGATS